jgi:hypothetical protein
MKPVVLHTPSFFSVTFIEEGRPILVMSTDDRYEKCLELYKNENYSGLKNFLCPDKALEQISDGDLIIDMDCGEILYKGDAVHNVVTGRIMDAIDGKLPYKHMLSFLKDTLVCDSFVVLNELYLFLESNESMPIMEDGSFVAYRVVDQNYMSKHVNPDGSKNRNMIGDVVTVERNKVNPDRNQTCAEGLHFCSYNYIPFYGWNETDRVMIVKVFPSDVISIPKDYNNAKGRCCKYEVIGEVADYERNSDEFRQRAEAKASELAYDYEDNGCEDEAWEEYCKANPTAQFEADLYYAMNGGQDRETHSTKELNADELMVDNIIKSQLKTLKSTTVRRVAKSTKPYLNCSIVLDIVNDLGYNVTHDEGTPVSSAEISYIAK